MNTLTFILADNTLVTQSISLFPINYPTVQGGQFTVTGDVVTSSKTPVSLSLYPNVYDVQCNLESANDWFINIDTGSNLTTVSGHSITGSVANVTFNLVDSVGNPVYEVIHLAPINKNTLFNGKFVLKDTLIYNTNTASAFTIPLIPQPYYVSLQGGIKHTHYTIYPTASCNANQCIVTTTNISNQITQKNNILYGYTAAASDARYMLSGSVSSNPTASYFNGTKIDVPFNQILTIAAEGNPVMIGPGNGGCLGIGITAGNPLYSLDVAGTIGNSDTHNFKLAATIADGISYINGQGPGYFGLGTTNPQYDLDVTRVGGGAYIGNSTDNLILEAYLVGGHNVIIQSQGGNVGIGVFNPQNVLDVAGNISCSVVTASLNGTASFSNTSSVALNANKIDTNDDLFAVGQGYGYVQSKYDLNVTSLNGDINVDGHNINVTAESGLVSVSGITNFVDNVGINQPSPSYRLDVNGSTHINNGSFIVDGITGPAGAMNVFQVNMTGGNSIADFRTVDGGSLQFQLSDLANGYAWSMGMNAGFFGDNRWMFYDQNTGGVPLCFQPTTDYVGIGNQINPQYTLDINGTIGDSSNGNFSIIPDSNGNGGTTLQLKASDNGQAMYIHIDSSGIISATTSP